MQSGSGRQPPSPVKGRESGAAGAMAPERKDAENPKKSFSMDSGLFTLPEIPPLRQHAPGPEPGAC